MSEFKIGDRVENRVNWTNLKVPEGTLGTVVETPQGSHWDGVHVQFDNYTPEEVVGMFGYPTWPMDEWEIEHA